MGAATRQPSRCAAAAAHPPRDRAPLLSLWLGVVLVGSLICGCHRGLQLPLEAGWCLNPSEPICTEAGENSVLLVFTVYALSEAVEPEALVWDDLLDPSRALAVLGPQLACEGVGPGVVSHFEVQRLQEGAVRINPLPCKTHHLLVVTEGRRAGERSVQILNLGRLQHKQRLCFELQDVFEPPSRRGECAFEFEVGPHVGLEASAQRSRR